MSDPASWGLGEVRQWLGSINLGGAYAMNFSDHRITGEHLLSGLTNEDFDILEVKILGDRKTLQNEILKLI